MGPYPVSSKLLLSGQTPESITPTIRSSMLLLDDDDDDAGNIAGILSSPRNSGVRVVKSLYFL
ncbi:hypothetical protein A2U01_0071834, partial [Trifolium medium]|nr:hypothetical protein [Trifolium medium]